MSGRYRSVAAGGVTRTRSSDRASAVDATSAGAAGAAATSVAAGGVPSHTPLPRRTGCRVAPTGAPWPRTGCAWRRRRACALAVAPLATALASWRPRRARIVPVRADMGGGGGGGSVGAAARPCCCRARLAAGRAWGGVRGRAAVVKGGGVAAVRADGGGDAALSQHDAGARLLELPSPFPRCRAGAQTVAAAARDEPPAPCCATSFCRLCNDTR